mmetsp:Transcript_20054/g.43639  ORF Transcript_20054/g.43639 Transcript_20054/m.43639 type:complete len:86 (+) Transcript_20054:3171-3428(+)
MVTNEVFMTVLSTCSTFTLNIFESKRLQSTFECGKSRQFGVLLQNILNKQRLVNNFEGIALRQPSYIGGETRFLRAFQNLMELLR